MTISVIIPSYRRLNTLERTLKILFDVDTVPDEVLIVDQTECDHGQNEIIELCKKYDIVKYVHLDTPSLTKARNVGIKESSGDLLIFMDDDVDVRYNTIMSVKEIMSNPTIAMIGGIDENSVSISSRSSKFFNKASWSKNLIGHVTPAVYGRFPDILTEVPVETEWAMGFFFVVRREIIDKYNIRFDENLKYYAYAEDLDFTYRYNSIIKNLGLKSIMTRRITVKHNVSNEYRLISSKAYCMIYAHRWYLRKKLFNSLKSNIAFLWSNIGDLLLAHRNGQSTRNIVKAQLFWLKNRNDIAKGNFHYEDFM